MVKIQRKRFLIGFYTDEFGRRRPKTVGGYEITIPLPLKKKRCRIIMSIGVELEGLTVDDLELMGFRKTTLYGHDAIEVDDVVMYLGESKKSVYLFVTDAEVNSIEAFEKFMKSFTKAVKKVFINTQRGD